MKLLWFYFSRTVVALTTVAGNYLLMVPALGVGALLLGEVPAFVSLTPLGLTTLAVFIALALSRWATEPFKATIVAIHTLLSPRRNPASQPVLILSGFAALVFLVAGITTGKIWELIGTLVALAINSVIAMAVLWVLAGTWYKPRERKDAVPVHLERLLNNLTLACQDFFAPESDYAKKREVPTKSGGTRTETYIDEDARYEATRAAIETLEEVAPHKYRIKFRNTTGKSDQKFITFFEGVASILSLHSYDLRDDDERKGHIQITVLDEEPDNEISSPHGMLLWK